jgi:gliding motility-associated-like protein
MPKKSFINISLTKNMMTRILPFLFLFFIQVFVFAQPSNDECATLFNLGEAPICPILDTFSNVMATASVISTTTNGNIPSCFNGSAPDADVWFSFDLPADGSLVNVQIELDAVDGPNGGIVQPQMAIYRGDCAIDGLEELDCVAALAGENSLEIVLLGLTPDFTYYLRIEDWSASASPNWGDFALCIKEPDVEFNMGDTDLVSFCSGTLYDSGGPDAAYSNGENNSFTICPADPYSCINLNLVSATIENNFDNLTFYAGNSTAAPVFLNITGGSGATSFGLDSDCITIGFTSDGSVTQDGFELTWECTTDACDNSFITCANPEIIPSLPFDMDDLTTCGTFNSQAFGPCPFGLDLLGGEDYIFTYDSPGDECITVELAGVGASTGISIYDACPEEAFNCIGTASSLANDTATIESAYLELAGTYYFVVDNAIACTDFDIFIDTTVCPVALPPATNCDDALSINGCGNIPSVIQVGQQMTDEPECFIPGVNDGSWGGIGQGHFTWFTFQAQADGDFGFLASPGNIFEASDIDINVWGPIADEADICDFMKNNQPVRSTWAGTQTTTGLTAENPFTGAAVTDPQEGAVGDGFVSTLPVVEGQWYLVLINDFGGSIQGGGISMDFSSSSAGALDPNAENLAISQDVAACPGSPFILEASGGSLYNWFPTAGLSCTDCPDPTVIVNGPMTYQVEITGACFVDTLSVDVAFLLIDAGPDILLCEGESLVLGAQSNLVDVSWEWAGFAGSLSCTDCANPILNSTGFPAGDYEFIAIASTTDCSDTDTIVVTVLPVSSPSYDIAENTILCEGENIDLGGSAIMDLNYSWTSSNGSLTSDESNPNVSPTETTTYYLEVTNTQCPNPAIDSVTISTVESPVIPILNDETICSGEEVLVLNIITSPDILYQWNPIVGVGDPSSANNVFTPTETTTYTLTALRGACEVEESFTVTVNPIPFITLEEVTICEGMETTLTATANVPGTFIWQPSGTVGETFETGPLNQTTEYTISFVDDNNCPAIDEIVTVTVEDGVEVTNLIADPDGAIAQGNTTTLTVETNPTDNIIYEWSTGGMSNTEVVTPIDLDGEIYYVTVTDQFGCFDSDSISIAVTGPNYQIPNVFTPDGDRLNDKFEVILNGDNIKVIEFKVFNRWGQKVHDGSGLVDHGWDGNIDGEPAPSDVYVYLIVLEFPDGEVVSESKDVTLIR